MTKKQFFLSAFTVFIQYYDYHLSGFLAANIAKYFFPADEVITKLLNTYLLLALAMVAKPVGAIIFGKIGDLKGRSNSFRISLFGTAIASFILCLCPSYASIGSLSIFILLSCRMIICGFVTSGSDGVRIYIYEHINKSQRSLAAGITAVFTLSGLLVASLSAWFFTLDYWPNYAWKVTFLIGSALGVIALIAIKMTNLSDSKQVRDSDEFHHFHNLPTKKIIKNNWKMFLVCMILAGSIGSTNQFLLIFFGTYNFEILHIIDRSLMQQYVSFGVVAYIIFSIIGGYVADKIGQYTTIAIGTFLVLICSVCICYYLSHKIFSEWLFIMICGLMPFITIPASVVFTQSIPIAIRYRLFSLSHALGSIVISAPTAFLSAFIYHKTQNSWLPFGYFICTIIMIFFSISYLNKRVVHN